MGYFLASYNEQSDFLLFWESQFAEKLASSIIKYYKYGQFPSNYSSNLSQHIWTVCDNHRESFFIIVFIVLGIAAKITWGKNRQPKVLRFFEKIGKKIEKKSDLKKM